MEFLAAANRSYMFLVAILELQEIQLFHLDDPNILRGGGSEANHTDRSGLPGGEYPELDRLLNPAKGVSDDNDESDDDVDSGIVSFPRPLR